MEKISDKQRILDELTKDGRGFGQRSGCVTVNQLYRRVLELERRPVETAEATLSAPDAQWVFLRRWLEDRFARTARPREQLPFRPFEYSPQMRSVLERCREHADCRSSSDPGFA